MLLAIGLTVLLSWRIGRGKGSVFIWLAMIASLAFPLELYGYITTLHERNNTMLYNLFAAAEFLMVLLMLRAWHPGWTLRLLLAGAIGLAGAAWNLLQLSSPDEMLVEAIMLFALLITALLALALWRMANTSTLPLHRLPEFWLFMGMLLYFGAMPPVVAMARYIWNVDFELATLLWSLVPALCTIRYFLAAYACWLQRTRPLEPTDG